MRFLGYDPACVKASSSRVSAGMAGHRPGRCSCRRSASSPPAELGIVPSIEMVIWVAVGGRGTLLGAVVGAIARQLARSALSEHVPGHLAVLPRRAVRRRRGALPGRHRRASLQQLSAALPSATATPAAARARRCAARSSRRASRGRSHDRAAATLRELSSSSFDGFTVARRPRPDGRAGRAALPDRPERRRQDDADRRHHRQDARRRRHGHVRRATLVEPRRRSTRSCASASAASSRRPSVFDEPDVLENVEVAAGFRNGLARRLLRPIARGSRARRGGRLRARRAARRGARAAAGSRTARSSGWRSRCCWCRTRSCCCSTSRWPA